MDTFIQGEFDGFIHSFYPFVGGVITLLSSYVMVSFQRKRFRFENCDSLQPFIKKLTIYSQITPREQGVQGIQGEFCSCDTLIFHITQPRNYVMLWVLANSSMKNGWIIVFMFFGFMIWS